MYLTYEKFYNPRNMIDYMVRKKIQKGDVQQIIFDSNDNSYTLFYWN